MGTLNRQRQIQFGPDGDSETLDLGKGRGWGGSITGGSVNFEISDGWELTDRFSYTGGDANTYGLVPDGGAVQLGVLIADATLDTRAVLDPAIIAGTASMTGSVTGRDIASTEYIQQFGAWQVLKSIESFTNDLSFQRSWDTGNVTVGYYAASSSVDEFWSLGNSRYEVVQNGGEVVTGVACNDPSVDSCGFNYDIDATGDATTNAFYAASTIDLVDRLTVDVGVRIENHQVSYSVDEGLDGQVTKFAGFDETKTSWTAAANYLFTDEISGFARINNGYRMPYFDEFRDFYDQYTSGNDLIQSVNQYELGFKWVTDSLSLYATGFFTDVDPVGFVTLGGATPPTISTQESMGVDLDGVWAAQIGFLMTLNATLQETEIKNGPNAGNETQRQPNWQLRLSPSYTFETGTLETSIYGTLSAVGDRWGEPANVNKLPGYEKLDLGVQVRINEAFTVQLSADNLTDEDALTESDPRTIAAPNGRYIMPRTFTLSVGYEF
jgi:outer membrane receptor protein involved in Fe transport